jgi:hypothetical protein
MSCSSSRILDTDPVEKCLEGAWSGVNSYAACCDTPRSIRRTSLGDDAAFGRRGAQRERPPGEIASVGRAGRRAVFMVSDSFGSTYSAWACSMDRS